MIVAGIGSIVVEALPRGKIKLIFIKGIFYVSKLQANTLSVSKLLSNELKAQLNLNECIIRGPDKEVIVIGLCKSNLYEINSTNVHGGDATNLI